MSRILVIDDNELIANMLREALTEHGYEVFVAMDGNQGYAGALKVRPDLIILDVQLPDVTGFDLCRIIKNKPEIRNIPIIMATGTARSTEEKVRSFQMGVDDYLLKPFEIPELIERVRAVLRRSESSRTPSAPIVQITPNPGVAPTPTLPPAPNETLQSLPFHHAIGLALVSPFKLPSRIFIPGISFFFLMASITLAYIGFGLSAGANISWPLLGLSIGVLWGLGVSILVMGGSLLGISTKWKEGAGLISLASSPLLLKLAGACLFSGITTLAPFYFSAGLPLFIGGAPQWLARLDAFEIWAAFLIYLTVGRLPGSSNQKAMILALATWVGVCAMAIALGRVGGS